MIDNLSLPSSCNDLKANHYLSPCSIWKIKGLKSLWYLIAKMGFELGTFVIDFISHGFYQGKWT